MLGVSESLDQISNRKMLLSRSSKEKEGSCLGSDGETSDYQRSTPSPRDGNSRIPELSTEGLEKVDEEGSWKSGGKLNWAGGLLLPPQPPPLSSSSQSAASPDLGFVDFSDYHHHHPPHHHLHNHHHQFHHHSHFTHDEDSTDKTAAAASATTGCDNVDALPPSPPLSSTFFCSLPCGDKPRHIAASATGIAVTANKTTSTIKSTATATSLSFSLSKNVTVQLEKLPLSSSAIILSCEAGKSSGSSSANSCEARKRRYPPVNDGRGFAAPTLAVPCVADVLNSFRICKKPKPTTAAATHSFPSFEPLSFYKKPSSGGSNCVIRRDDSCDFVCKKSVLSSENDDGDGTSPAAPTSSVLSTADETTSNSSATTVNNNNVKKYPSGLSAAEEDRIAAVTTTTSITEGSEGSSTPALLTRSNSSDQQAFRFPTVPGNHSATIPCKWEGCDQGFKTHGKLSDHIKTAHMSPQLETEGNLKEFSCLWLDCKVFGKKSSSRCWLEKHVPLHGGKFAFTCIVEGCKLRFSSQVMLQRHVNSHFSESPSGASAQSGGPRKSIEGAPARKVLKRAGVRLKFRKLPFSARIFDFFDAGLMAGIRDQVSRVEAVSQRLGIQGDAVTLSSRALALRTGANGTREVKIRWSPENMLPDEWVALDDVVPTKTVRLSLLPEAAKSRLQHQLMLAAPPPPTKHARKNKRIEPPSVFLTPDEVAGAVAPTATTTTYKQRLYHGGEPFRRPLVTRTATPPLKLART